MDTVKMTNTYAMGVLDGGKKENKAEAIIRLTLLSQQKHGIHKIM